MNEEFSNHPSSGDAPLDSAAILLGGFLDRLGKGSAVPDPDITIVRLPASESPLLSEPTPKDLAIDQKAREIIPILDIFAELATYGTDTRQVMINKYFEGLSQIGALEFIADTLVMMGREWISPEELETHMTKFSTVMLTRSLRDLYGLRHYQELDEPVRENIENLFGLTESELARRGYRWEAKPLTKNAPSTIPTLRIIPPSR